MTSPGVASAGAVALDVEPDATDFYPRLRAQVLPAAEQIGRDIAARIAAPIVRNVADAITQGVRDGARVGTAEATRAGDTIGNNIGRAIRAQVQRAVATLPDVRIDGDTSGLERKLEEVRGQVAAITNANVRVDVDSADAQTELEFVTLQVRELAALSPTIRVELAGAREVQDELAFITLQAEDLARLSPTVHVDVSGAGEAAQQLVFIGGLARELGTFDVKIHVEVNDAGALEHLAIVSAAARAAGRDVTVNVDVDTGGAIASLVALISMETLAKIGMVSLGVAGGLLATTLVPAAAAAAAAVAAIGPAAVVGIGGIGVLALGLSGVIGAIGKLDQQQGHAAASGRGVASSQNAIASAAAGVESAERALANTRAGNADAAVRANQRVADAERVLAQAKRDSLAAELALTAAREAARQAQEDLANSVTDVALSQRQAVFAVADAQAALQAVQANPLSTDEQRGKAQLAYDQAVQNLAEIELRQKRLQVQQAASDRAGIEGSAQVLAARDKIAQAKEKERQADEQLGGAVRDRAAQQRQSEFSLANAVDAVANAQRGLAQAHQQAASAGVSGAAAQGNALAGLSAPARQFVGFIRSLKPLWQELQAAAQGGLLPGIEGGIKALLPVMPAIIGLVRTFSSAMGDLFLRAGKALASPFWVTFFEMIQNSLSRPLIRDFGTIIGGVARGLASLAVGFAPLTVAMAGGLANMASAFARWAAQVVKSQGFKDFIAYVTTNGPVLLDTLGQIAVLAIRLGIVLAPLGAMVLKVVDALLRWVNGLTPGQFTALEVAIAAVGAAIAIATGSVLAIIVAIALLAGGLVYAWTHFRTFRVVVETVWNAIATAALWLWNTILWPIFSAIRNFIMDDLVPVFLLIWHQVIKPIFTAIAIAAVIMWAVLRPILIAIWWVISNVLAPVFLWLFHNIVGPVFKMIVLAIRVAWAIIEVIFGVISIAIKALGAVFSWLYDHAIKPAWDFISKHISDVWNNDIQPILDVMGSWITVHVAPAFKAGVAAIGRIWDGLKNLAKAPIKFLIDTVLNKGLLAGYNKIATMFGVKPDDVQIAMPAGFATGGFVSGAGGPTSDSILARLSNGEYVIPANIVRMFGVRFFDWLIGKSPFGGKAVHPGDGSEGLAFASGGLVPGYASGGFVGSIESLWNGLKDPLGWVRGKVDGLLDTIPGGRYIVDLMSGVGRHLIDGVVHWLGGKITNQSSGQYVGPVSADVKSVQDWVRAQAGKPYIWASAGPAGFDCSGAVGAVWRLLHGLTPNARQFSTESEDPYFPKLNQWGVLTAGWAHPGERGGSPGVGHTAANLAGLGFESRGGDGFVVGNNATKVTSFARFGTYDQGGWLLPGLTVAYNGTGQPERIYTADQNTALMRGQRGGGPQITNHIYPKVAVFDERQLAAQNAADATRMRIGRPD